ncbi:tRNA pseudouridine38-40 synthase [Dethiosulfatibacter aminovorans DSM 17477]|uniref:tRNA pseudouridine synthase A n=1 Tax=Dethiosulfatibacter aminovorans DSM 17477 TaxID=1121476 RepID=A0A1M6KU28_9FIRM|nr:tRNA pseudouridine(38-40) synthase TruA [Dethiosulfatibacter aminovorans]SHJ62477.1 tRNA pseudouridine38-40 synthase [Dethiosulfatibacter aminovorans DSM 17477]
MKFRYKMEIAYDGTRYQGWQRLGNTDMTIQGKIEGVLSRYLERNMEIDGSGRTDAGVHALCQTASFETCEKVDREEMLKCFQKYLPEDIQIRNILLESSDFHGRYSVKSKAYRYVINNNGFNDIFNRKYQWHITRKLDVEKMRKVAEVFSGSHDFTAFTTVKSKKKSMVRNVKSLDISEEKGILYIRIEADGFLHNMVRKIVGVLVEAGLGNMTFEEVRRILEEKDRAAIPYMAPAHGLFLESVEY